MSNASRSLLEIYCIVHEGLIADVDSSGLPRMRWELSSAERKWSHGYAVNIYVKDEEPNLFTHPSGKPKKLRKQELSENPIKNVS